MLGPLIGGLVGCADEGASGAGGDAHGSNTTGASSSAGGGERDAFVVYPGPSAIVEVRIQDAALTLSDDDPTRWRMRVGDRDAVIDQDEVGAVLALRARNDTSTVDAVYLRARLAAAEGEAVIVDHLPSGRQWTFAARAVAPTRFPVNPILVHGDDGSGTALDDADMAKIASAWEPVRAMCGVELVVQPARTAVVAGAGALMEGIAAIDDEVRPADLVIPRSVDAVLDAAGAPDDELRLLIWPGASSVAAPPMLHEQSSTFYYVPSVLLYDTYANGSFVGATQTLDRRYRFALASDQAPLGADLPWSWELIAVHELGHLLGLSHPDVTSDTSDDFLDNWMAGAHAYPESFGSKGTFPSVTQRQCILLARDLNAYARP